MQLTSEYEQLRTCFKLSNREVTLTYFFLRVFIFVAFLWLFLKLSSYFSYVIISGISSGGGCSSVFNLLINFELLFVQLYRLALQAVNYAFCERETNSSSAEQVLLFLTFSRLSAIHQCRARLLQRFGHFAALNF